MADPAVGYDGNPLNGTNGGTAPAGNSDFLKQLAAALAAAGAGIGGRAIANSQGNPLTSAVPPELSSMLQQANARQAYQNPLFQATTQGVYDMLPDFAKNGTQLSGSLPNSIPAPSGTTGASGPGMGTAASLGGLSALLALLGSGGGGGGDLAKAFEAIKKKFAGGQNAGGTQQVVSPNAGYFDSNGDWTSGFEDAASPTPQTFGRALGPDGQPLPVGSDPFQSSGKTSNGDPNQALWDWLSQNGFGGSPFGGGGGDNVPPEAVKP